MTLIRHSLDSSPLEFAMFGLRVSDDSHRYSDGARSPERFYRNPYLRIEYGHLSYFADLQTRPSTSAQFGICTCRHAAFRFNTYP